MLIDSASLTAKPSTAVIRDYWRLMKPGVMALVVFTGAIGIVAAPVALHLTTAILTLFCIALGSGGGAALNMWYDADIDAIMKRTRLRPIPAGLIAEQDVLAVGFILSALSVMLLGLTTNWAAAGVLAFAIWFYACFYTMILKRRTAQNIVIGGAAGAFPPIIGWLAMTPHLTFQPLLYFLIIFFWTPPHFWALALYRNEDYKSANIPMLPVTSGIASTLNHIVAYTVILIIISLLPQPLGYAGTPYTVISCVLNSVFIVKAIRLKLKPDAKTSMGLFGYSIIYLFLLFTAILMDKLLTWY